MPRVGLQCRTYRSCRSAWLLSPFTSHRLRRFISNPKRADFEWLAAGAAEGSVRPVIGSTHTLAETVTVRRTVRESTLRAALVPVDGRLEMSDHDPSAHTRPRGGFDDDGPGHPCPRTCTVLVVG